MLGYTSDLRIGVVGNCVSGKSTLVAKLNALGFVAVNVPQEHSVSPRFWRRVKADFLVYLCCSLSVAQARRPIPWGQERLDSQWEILADAKRHADLVIDTDPWSADQVVGIVLEAIRNRSGGQQNE